MDQPVHPLSDPGPAPTPRECRALRSEAHHLKAGAAIGRGGVTDAFVADVRMMMMKGGLLKVRVDADTAAEADALSERLAAAIPCHLVGRVGRVAILYRPASGEE